MNNLWIWFVVGLIPYYVNKQQARNGWLLQVHALFWSLEILFQQHGWRQWILRVPLIKQLQHAARMAIKHLEREDLP